MKLKYQQQKGGRFKRCHFWDTHCDDDAYWYSHINGMWVTDKGSIYGSYSNYQRCKSVRAFRRKLKRCPKDVKFTLTSKYIGCDVYGYGQGD